MEITTQPANFNSENTTIIAVTKSFLCFKIPFCDVSDCDRTKYHSPMACPGCSNVSVAIFFIVLVVLSAFIFLGNMGIILVITRNKIFHNAFNMFKCSLALADLLVGVFVVPSGAYMLIYHLATPFDQSLVNSTEYIIDMEGQYFQRGTLCDRLYLEEDTPASATLSMISVLSIMVSIFHLVLLSIDRFLAVRWPIKYNQGRALKNRWAAYLIIAVWATSTVLSVVLPSALGPDHFSSGLTPTMIFSLSTTNGNAGLTYAAVALGLPFLVLFGLNFATGMIIFRKRGKLKVPNSSIRNNNGTRSNEVKATITLLVMVLVFSLTTIPSMAGVTFYNSAGLGDGNAVYVHGVTYCILILLLVSNSAWNFIIYSWRNNNFRKALKDMLQCTRNGKRRRFRWSTVKRAALRHSEKKRRRKKLSQRSVTTSNGGCRDTSVRSVDTEGRTNHRTFNHMTSVSSTISNSSNNYTTVSHIPVQHTNSDLTYCHSPTIPEEDDVFFSNMQEPNTTAKTPNHVQSNGTRSSKTENHRTKNSGHGRQCAYDNSLCSKETITAEEDPVVVPKNHITIEANDHTS